MSLIPRKRAASTLVYQQHAAMVSRNRTASTSLGAGASSPSRLTNSSRMLFVFLFLVHQFVRVFNLKLAFCYISSCAEKGKKRTAEDISTDVSTVNISADDLNCTIRARCVFLFTVCNFLLSNSGRELAESVRSLCANNAAFKGVVLKKQEQWGVVLDTDDRLTGKNFGDFKTKTRQESEARLRQYMLAPSQTRSDSLDIKGGFTIAVTLASSGMGKSRFIDDAMRMPLAASPHFDHFLRLAISFNGDWSGTTYHYPVSTRILSNFFVGIVPKVNATLLLSAIDDMLLARFDGQGEDKVSLVVLRAIEALYFQSRGNKLGRTVLMVDEISNVTFLANNTVHESVVQSVNEQTAYRILANFVDSAPLSQSAKYGRRGCVITALKFVEAGALTSSLSGRELLWLPLGKFDVWDAPHR
jgi:hypothetical protein